MGNSYDCSNTELSDEVDIGSNQRAVARLRSLLPQRSVLGSGWAETIGAYKHRMQRLRLNNKELRGQE